MSEDLTAREFVLQRVDRRTDTDGKRGQDASSDLWTGRRAIVEVGKRPTYPYSEDELQEAWEDLVAEGTLFSWKGLTAPGDEEHLRAIIEAELEAGITRKILIGKINRRLGGST